jgi:uncharacterized membrane protein YcaP (DUF421 family)
MNKLPLIFLLFFIVVASILYSELEHYGLKVVLSSVVFVMAGFIFFSSLQKKHIAKYQIAFNNLFNIIVALGLITLNSIYNLQLGFISHLIFSLLSFFAAYVIVHSIFNKIEMGE